DAPPPGAAPGTAAAVPGADLPGVLAEPHQGPHRAEALRLAGAGAEPRAIPGAAPDRHALARAGDPGGRPPRRRLLFRRPARLPRATLPRKRSLGLPSGRAGLQLRAGRGDRPPPERRAQRSPRARSA